MNIDWISLLFDAAGIIIGFLFYNIIKPVANQWLDEHLESEFKTIIKDSVKYAEQKFTEATGKSKKEIVTDIAKDAIEKCGLEISDTYLDTLIESTVFTVKKIEVNNTEKIGD